MRRSCTAPPRSSMRLRHGTSRGQQTKEVFFELPIRTKGNRGKKTKVSGNGKDPDVDIGWNHGKDVMVLAPLLTGGKTRVSSPLQSKSEITASDSPSKPKIDDPSNSAEECAEEDKDDTEKTNPEQSSLPYQQCVADQADPPTGPSATLPPVPSPNTTHVPPTSHAVAAHSNITTSSAPSTNSSNAAPDCGSPAGPSPSPPIPSEPAQQSYEPVSHEESPKPNPNEMIESPHPSTSVSVSQAGPATSQPLPKPSRSVSFSNTVQVRQVPNRRPPTTIPVSETVVSPPTERDYLQPLTDTKVTTYSRKRSKSTATTKASKPPAKKRKTASAPKQDRPKEGGSGQNDDLTGNEKPAEVNRPPQDWGSTASGVAKIVDAMDTSLTPLEIDAIVGLVLLSGIPVDRGDSSTFVRPSSSTQALETRLAVPRPSNTTPQVTNKGKAVDRQENKLVLTAPTRATTIPFGTRPSVSITNIHSLLNEEPPAKPTLFEKYAFRPESSTIRQYALSPDSDE